MPGIDETRRQSLDRERSEVSRGGSPGLGGPDQLACREGSQETGVEPARRGRQGIRPRVLLAGPMPPTKRGVTTFMLNLIASDLRHALYLVPFITARLPKRIVIDNWGYGSILRGATGNVVLGGLTTLWRPATLAVRVVVGRIDLVWIQASDYQAFWESALCVLMAQIRRRPVAFRIGGAADLIHQGSPPRVQRWIAAALAGAVGGLALSREMCRRLGREGCEIVRRRYSPAALSLLSDAYVRLLDRDATWTQLKPRAKMAAVRVAP